MGRTPPSPLFKIFLLAFAGNGGLDATNSHGEWLSN
jgi:hypothetical protein